MDHVSFAVRPPRAAASAFARIAVTALAGIAVTVGMVFAFAPAPPPPAMADPPVGGPSNGGDGPLGPEGCESLGAMPIIGTQFTSIIKDDIPQPTHTMTPDANGAVSEDWVVTATNEGIRIHDRAGNVVDSASLDDFWISESPEEFVFDPRVLFSVSRQRWVAVSVTHCVAAESCGAGETAANTSRLLIATTVGPDPAFANWVFSSAYPDPTLARSADFPTLGFNGDWIVVSVNMVLSFNDRRASLFVFDWDDIDSPLLHLPPGFDAVGGYYAHIMQPCVHPDDDPTDVVYLVDQDPQWDHTSPSCVDNCENGQWHHFARLSRVYRTGGGAVAWEVLGASGGGAGLIALTCTDAYSAFHCPHTEATTCGGGPCVHRVAHDHERFHNAVFRSGGIWTSQSGRIGDCLATESRIFYYRFNPYGPALDLCERIPEPPPSGPATPYRQSWPSIAVNCAGDVCIGFTRTGPSQCPGPRARAFVRLANAQVGEIHLKSSDDCMVRRPPAVGAPNGPIRFDYSGTVVDPVDDTSFWTVQVYGNDTPGCCTPETSRWASIWTRLVAP